MRRYSTSPSIIQAYTAGTGGGRRNSTASSNSNNNSAASEEERLRRRSQDSVNYDHGAITTILHNNTFSSLLEQAEREREEMLAVIEAAALNSKAGSTNRPCSSTTLAAITEEDYDAGLLGPDPLSDELVDKYRKHFLKATRHLQQELPNSYVLLTGIGYVPSVISMVQYLEPDSYYFEQGQGRTYLYLVLSAISFYIITYALLYYVLFPWFAASMNGDNLAPLKDVISPDHDPPTIWATLDYNLIRRVVDAPPGLHYMPSILGFYRLMYIVYDIASGIFSFIMLTAIILSEKNENYYNGGGIEQMVFTVWIFIINTLMFLVHIYALFRADTELRRQWHQRNKHRFSQQQGDDSTTTQQQQQEQQQEQQRCSSDPAVAVAPEMEASQFLPDDRQCSTPPPVVVTRD